MPLSPCKAPLCPALLPVAGWCDQHRHLSPRYDRRAYHRHYDQHKRNADSKAFYNSAAWKTVRESVLADSPVCTECRRAWSTTVHHKKPLEECTPAEALNKNNLQACCIPCHGTIEAKVRSAKAAQ